MLKDRNPKVPHSVRTSLLISYMVVLLIPILFNFVVLFINFKNVQKQTDLALAVADEQLTSLVNTYIREVRTNSSALILSDTSQSLMNYSDQSPTAHQINQLCSLQKDLLYKITVCDYIEGIYVLFPKSGTVLTEQSIYYDYNFSYKCRRDLSMTLEEWKAFVDFDGYERISILHSSLDGTDHILLARKNRATIGKSPEMLVVTALKVDTIRSVLNELSMEGRSLALLYDRSSGNILASTLAGEGAEISYTLEDGVLSAKKARVSARHTNFDTWQCAILTPQSVYLSSFASSIAGTVIYLLVSLPGGVGIILYMTQRQYSPVEKITERLLAAMEQNTLPSNANEYEQIEGALALLLHKRSSDQEKELVLQQSFTENLLRTILAGHIHKDSITYRHAVNNGILFDSNRFLVMLYSVQDIDTALYQIEAEYDNALYALLDTIVCAAAQDPSGSRYKRYAVEIDEQIACIVCCPDGVPEEQILGDMQRDSETIRDFFDSKFGFVLSAAISDIHEGSENISACFNEARETADYMETMGLSSRAFLYSAIPAAAPVSIAFSDILEKERQFCNCMKAYDFAASRQLLGEIIERFDLTHSSAAEARMRVYGLISVISSALEDVKPLLEENQIAYMNLDGFLHIKDVNALCRQAEEILNQLIEAGIRQKKAASASREDKMVQYVDENLTDPNLNISVIADRFGMSPSYFSRVFKRNTGMGLLDYIHQHRIELAKGVMMEAPAVSLKEIAERVGYTTPLAMNRAFRRYEGISPSSFREHLHRGNA